MNGDFNGKQIKDNLKELKEYFKSLVYQQMIKVFTDH